MTSESLKRSISVGAMVLLVLHLFWPGLGIDLVTIALLFVAALPWVGPVLKSLAESGVRSIEIPGGIKIGLGDVKSATDKVIRGTAALGAPMPREAVTRTLISPLGPPLFPGGTATADSLAYLGDIAGTDANLALVALRVEIERRVRSLAEVHGVPSHRTSLGGLLHQLQRREVLPAIMAAGLTELVGLGNRAAHGVDVTEDAAAWVLDIAPSIAIELDALEAREAAQESPLVAD